MLYRKEETIELGNKCIAASKRKWIIALAIVSSLFIIFIFEYIFVESLRNEMPLYSFILLEALLLSFVVFSIVYLLIRKTDPLLEGCKHYERMLKRVIRKKNKINRDNAKRESERTGKSVSYSFTSTTFSYEELFRLLKENDEIKHVGYKDISITNR